MLTRNHKTRFEVSDKRRLTFYAAVFNQTTDITEMENGILVRYRESIHPKAFDRALASDAEVIANIDHDEVQTFAKRSSGQLLLQSDPHGLFASTWVQETPEGDSILERVKSGELDGCSFRFVPVLNRVGEDIVERMEVKLYDVCLTATPAYSGTEVHVRTLHNKMPYLLARYKYAKIKDRTLHKSS